ncbi:uncharacterized protein O3C94_006180 [Discoglossus pictus]
MIPGGSCAPWRWLTALSLLIIHLAQINSTWAPTQQGSVWSLSTGRPQITRETDNTMSSSDTTTQPNVSSNTTVTHQSWRTLWSPSSSASNEPDSVTSSRYVQPEETSQSGISPNSTSNITEIYKSLQIGGPHKSNVLGEMDAVDSHDQLQTEGPTQPGARTSSTEHTSETPGSLSIHETTDPGARTTDHFQTEGPSWPSTSDTGTTTDLYMSPMSAGSHSGHVTSETDPVTISGHSQRARTSQTSETSTGDISGIFGSPVTSGLSLSDATSETSSDHFETEGTPQTVVSFNATGDMSGHAENLTDLVTSTFEVPEASTISVGTKEPQYNASGTEGTSLWVTPIRDTIPCHDNEECPPFSSCTNLKEVLVCQCDPGYYLHRELGCVIARTFPARISMLVLKLGQGSWSTHVEDKTDSIQMKQTNPRMDELSERAGNVFQNVFGEIDGYLSTSVTEYDPMGGYVSLLHHFSVLSPVTERSLQDALMVSPIMCVEGSPDCRGATYHSLDLCDFATCDSASSACWYKNGLATCMCRAGYYKFHPEDRACRACDSGNQWKDNSCLRCPFGFSGFNCGEPFLLALVVVSSIGVAILAGLITVLVFYFRRKKPAEQSRFMESIMWGVPTDERVLSMPRAQFSWRREWDWEDPGKPMASVYPERATRIIYILLSVQPKYNLSVSI